MRRTKRAGVLVGAAMVLGLGVVAPSPARAKGDCFKCDESGTRTVNRGKTDHAACPPGLGLPGDNTGWVCLAQYEKETAECVAGEELKTCTVDPKKSTKTYNATKFAAGSCETVPSGGSGGHCGTATGAATTLTGYKEGCKGEAKGKGDPKKHNGIKVPGKITPGGSNSIVEIPGLNLELSSRFLNFAAARGGVLGQERIRTEVAIAAPFPRQATLLGPPSAVTVVEGDAVVVDLFLDGDRLLLGLDVGQSAVVDGERVVLHLEGVPMAIFDPPATQDRAQDPVKESSAGNCGLSTADPQLGAQLTIENITSEDTLTVVIDVDDGCVPESAPRRTARWRSGKGVTTLP